MAKQFADLGMTEQQGLLRAAFDDWLNDRFPEATTVGDVIIAREYLQSLGYISIVEHQPGPLQGGSTKL